MQLHCLVRSRTLLAVFYLFCSVAAETRGATGGWCAPVIAVSMSHRDLLANLLEELRSSVLYVWWYAAVALGYGEWFIRRI